MSWIPKGSSPQTAVTTAPPAVAPLPRTFAHSLEAPIVMSVRKIPAPVYGTLMTITTAGCTLRSLVLMERGTQVEFDLGGSVVACGRVTARRTASQGARFEYDVQFEMGEANLDAVAHYVRELERRAAVGRSEAALAKIPTTDQRRGAYRAIASIPVVIRLENDIPREGRIGDISCSGIRLICGTPIAIGTAVDLRFTLPSNVLDVYPEETAVIDMSGPVPRRVGRSDQRRPFEEMRLQGRIVTRFDRTREGRELLGVAFVEIDGFLREEIARFTHAVQLAKLSR